MQPPAAQHPPVVGRDSAAPAGTAPGINIAPGSRDDGWLVPSPVVLSDGTRVQLYKDGEALRAAFEAIQSARQRICLEAYIFRSDATGRAFADLLCQKARQGVRVYVVYDAFGSLTSDEAMFADMARAGVRLAEFHPVKPWACDHTWRPFDRDHRKLLVIDDQAAGLGGLNVGSEYAGSWVVASPPHLDAWRDNAVGVTGTGAVLLLDAFARMWRYTQQGGRIRQVELMYGMAGGDFGVLASVPTRSSPLGPFLGRLLREARHTIQLTMSYLAPPDDLMNALCAAAGRGVRVQLMLPARTDVPLLRIAAQSFYERMLASGIEVYERLGAVLHAKTMCIDGRTTILGSTNLDYRSIESNCELSVLVRSELFGRQIGDLFEHDIRHARRITADQWRHRPLRDRVVQWAVHRARYLL